MTSDYATRLRALAETVEQSRDTSTYVYPQAARDALLTALFAIAAGRRSHRARLARRERRHARRAKTSVAGYLQ